MDRRGFLSSSVGTAAVTSLGLLGCLFGRGRRVRRRLRRRELRQGLREALQQRTCELEFIQDGKVMSRAICSVDDVGELVGMRTGPGQSIRVREIA